MEELLMREIDMLRERVEALEREVAELKDLLAGELRGKRIERAIGEGFRSGRLHHPPMPAEA